MKSKYGSVITSCDGYSFASKLEASVFSILKNRENIGNIKILQVQDHVYLTKARVTYVPDFKCLDLKLNEEFWVEAKGMEGPRWPTIKKLWKVYGPGKLEIWKGTHLKPYLDEVITPQEIIAS